MNDEKIISVELSQGELSHLINDIIAYMWDLEEKGLDKDNTYGYFSRKALKEKLQTIEHEEFPELPTAAN